ncbi:synaptic vesicle glycoprotein 2C-like [Scleropages formosus]|uniref:Synaptic vesicle glycoprotein 2C-like n=1 Tax=Scleropages formosus TaxID=113540 RepID=A0A0P7UMU4_SCLFO|nr:synaptic vesicle glycoprotein 2C-like [Scleropages formosus]
MSRRNISEDDEGDQQEPLLGAIPWDPEPGGEGDDGGDPEETKLSYEEAVEKAGFGLFHGLLLGVCGWANASDAVEILCVSFLLPTARCDLRLSSSDMGVLNASVFLGMMVGGCLWGSLADQRGRRKVLVVSLAVNGIFGALAGLAPNFWMFLFMRIVSGLGVGGSIPVVFSYFSEFQPRKRRGMMISALATFWMAGNILAAGLAWLIIPSSFSGFWLGSLHFQSWRLFVMLCSIPSLSSALVFGLAMPESPRFLMEAGLEEAAIEVFQKMFRTNQWGSSRPLLISGLQTTSGCKNQRGKAASGSRLQHIVCLTIRGLDPMRQIFFRPLTSRSIVLLIIFYCISFGYFSEHYWMKMLNLNTFGRGCDTTDSQQVVLPTRSPTRRYYGLWMWLPELFRRMEMGGLPCSNVSHGAVSPDSQNESCYPVKTAVYMEGFITAASNLPGNIFTILLMDVVGGRVLLSCSLLVSGVSVFSVWAVKTKTQSLVMSCVFSAVSVVAWNALDVVSTELYPTALRSSALGFFTGIARVAALMGNLAFGQLVDTNCAIPVLLVAALLASGGITALKLPQTKQAELM